mgnify:CR=1 FL=1
MTFEDIFADNSILKSVITGYKPRQGQRELSKFIFECLRDYSDCVIEAPTGSGKTIAYLLPALELDRKVIVSTKSKQLMNQLFFKDLEALLSLDKWGKKVSFFKGRRNYFCTLRYNKLILPYGEEYQDVKIWRDQFDERSIVEVPPYFWGTEIHDKITADSYQCVGSKCSYIGVCSFYMAKNKAAEADITITNHHMILTDIASRVKGGFGGNFEFCDNVIFDEAHSIIDIYPLYSGDEVSLGSIKNILRDNRGNISPELYKTILNHIKNFENSISEKSDMKPSHIQEIYSIFLKTEEVLKNCADDDDMESFRKISGRLKFVLENEGVRTVEPSGSSLLFRNIPLSAGETFWEGLKKIGMSSVFISATLTFGGNFDFFNRELGLANKVKEYIVEKSPFEKNAYLVVPEGIGDDVQNKKSFYFDVLSNFNGPVIMIFNSLRMMNEIYTYLKNSGIKREIILQRDVNLGEYFADRNSVILGCSVLREGIDIKTNSKLKCLIMDKLPFENISDVYLAKRAEDVEKSGGNKFSSFYLPRAVLYFKQALGRLIRGEEDYGLWVVLDDRILKKNYGKAFLDTIREVDIYTDFFEALKLLEEKYG